MKVTRFSFKNEAIWTIIFTLAIPLLGMLGLVSLLVFNRMRVK
jgi:hypothetical protein